MWFDAVGIAHMGKNTSSLTVDFVFYFEKIGQHPGKYRSLCHDKLVQTEEDDLRDMPTEIVDTLMLFLLPTSYADALCLNVRLSKSRSFDL